MEASQPLESKDRITLLDGIRGIALCGILLMNITLFARPITSGFNLTVLNETSLPDIVTWALQTSILEGSFRGLFSLLFGAGTLLIISRLEKSSGLNAADIYYRRLIWLLLFGLFDAYVLLWPGDILYAYAICGLFLFPFRKASLRLISGIVIFLIAITVYNWWNAHNDRLAMREKGEAALVLEKEKKELTDKQKGDLEKWKRHLDETKPEALKKKAEKETNAMLGSYGEVKEELKPLILRFETKMFYRAIFLDVLIFMLLGMILFRTGVLTGEKPTSFYVTLMVAGYVIGMGYGLINAKAWYDAKFDYYAYIEASVLPVRLYQLQRVCLVMGHIGLIVLMWRSRLAGWIIRLFNAVGQMALTNYLLQSVICTLVFYGYGLGYFGKLARFELLYFIAGMWFFHVVFSNIWLRYFLFGPAEWLWRSLTYWKVQPIRKASKPEMVYT
jgi:uncharacterized protein